MMIQVSPHGNATKWSSSE